jgi:hypothetical protein
MMKLSRQYNTIGAILFSKSSGIVSHGWYLTTAFLSQFSLVVRVVLHRPTHHKNSFRVDIK